MTIVEFFDRNALDNIASALSCVPNNVIFVGDSSKRMARAIKQYDSILKARGIDVDMSYKTVNKNQLQSILTVLSSIVESNNGCVFDLSGGDDLLLVGVGIIMEKYKGLVNCHRYNPRTDVLTDCDGDGKVCKTQPISLSCEECIELHGGQIITKGTGAVTYNWSFTEDFINDIESMWEISKKSGRLWNVQTACIGAICSCLVEPSLLDVEFHKNSAEAILKNNGYELVLVEWLFKSFEKHGLIKNLILGDKVSFSFKNEQVKKCLTTAGQVLELFVASRLADCKDKGANLYNDIKVGSVINWDSENNSDDVPTINEIDVIAMKGFIPVFISCKNGDFDSNELYKLNSVAEKFGGSYSKKVIVTTELDSLGAKAEYIRARAVDMGIQIIEKIDTMSLSEINRELKSLWTNK